MNKRAVTILCALLLLPSLAFAAPVKRIKMKGTAKETAISLKGVQSNDAWTTPVSITQSGSSVTINFRLIDGKSATSILKKAKGGWMSTITPFEIPPPSNSNFYYCEMSGYVILKLSGKTGSFARYVQLACDDDVGTVKAYDILTIKLKK
jgi:hypothetical protein